MSVSTYTSHAGPSNTSNLSATQAAHNFVDRLFLASVHFNANANQKQAVTKDRDLQRKVARPHATKGTPVAKIVKEQSTHGKNKHS